MKSKVPRNFNAFLCNSENKTRLISLIREVLMKRRVEILRSLKCQAICISMYNFCELLDDTNCIELPELSNHQEEADTKVCLHAINALNEDPNKNVIIRSHSGDFDINILLTSLIIDSVDRVFLDVNIGKNRKILRLSDVELSTEEKKALIGFHAFTGNDYVSSFFGKGKLKCWKVLKSDPQYMNAFISLGSTWELDDDTFKTLEKYVCELYGKKRDVSVNEARYKVFKESYEKKNIIPDMSLLPPCQETLKLHCSRACFVSRLWRLTNHNQVNAPSPVGHGWDDDMIVLWIKEAFPEDVELLVTESQEELDDFEDINWESNSDSESDSDYE